ncbi:MAG: helix-turn-helix domain-containing protein [Firmicutes bacterium]|nr:helix-turn-helix domain-containing protein [Bacillota bacterium]
MDYYGTMESVEKKMIETALIKASGNKTKAAEILGIPGKTLVYRMEKLSII